MRGKTCRALTVTYSEFSSSGAMMREGLRKREREKVEAGNESAGLNLDFLFSDPERIKERERERA